MAQRKVYILNIVIKNSWDTIEDLISETELVVAPSLEPTAMQETELAGATNVKTPTMQETELTVASSVKPTVMQETDLAAALNGKSTTMHKKELDVASTLEFTRKVKKEPSWCSNAYDHKNADFGNY